MLKIKLGAGVVGAMALALSSTAVQAQEISEVAMRDLTCFGVFAAVYGNPDLPITAEERAGVAMGIAYYLGRLQGRDPQIDWLDYLQRNETAVYARVQQESEVQRCGAELVVIGESMMAFGND